MIYEITYSFCMMISTILEMIMVFDFYKAFYSKREIFFERVKEGVFFATVVLINTCVNLRNSNELNFIVTCFLFLIIGIVLVEGNIIMRLFHWIMLIFVILSAEFIFFVLLKVSADMPTNKIYKNEFMMISSIMAIKLLEFVILSFIKQVSKIHVKKVSIKVFVFFIMIPVATLGLMAVIPYIRASGDILTFFDIMVLIFYLILLCGNIALFFVFMQYCELQEEKMLNELSQARYEERQNRHNIEGEIEERYKEQMHDIKYYLRQMSIYLEKGRVEEIEDVLNELQIGIHQGERNVICGNAYLNCLLLDFKGEAEKHNVQTEIFVEPGFKMEYMREIDITSLLGNLLDNAIEAAEKCKNGKIHLDMYMQNDGAFSVLLLENNYVGEIIQEENRLLTTKKEKWGHGIGLRNVNRIVRLYDGYMQQDFEAGTCVTTVIIPTKAFGNTLNPCL